MIIASYLRKIYDEALAKGYVETSVIKCLIIGAAGVGKTHLKHLLFGTDPPKKRVSTGLADNPVRAMSFSRVGININEDDWVMVQSDEDLMHIIGKMIKDDAVDMKSSLNVVVRALPKMAINNVLSDVPGADHTPADPMTSLLTTDTISVDVSITPAADTLDKLIRLSNTSSGNINSCLQDNLIIHPRQV